MARTTDPVAPASTAPVHGFAFILKKSFLSALVALVLFSLMIGVRTEAGPTGQLIYWTRFGDLAMLVVGVFAGSILVELVRGSVRTTAFTSIGSASVIGPLGEVRPFVAPALLVFTFLILIGVLAFRPRGIMGRTTV